MSVAKTLRQIMCLAVVSCGVALVAAAQVHAQDALEEAESNAMEQGFQALEQEDYESARTIFNEVIDANAGAVSPGLAMAYIGRARALAGLDLHQEAIADFQEAFSLTSFNTEEARVIRAELQYQRGKMLMELNPQQYLGTALPDLQAAYEANRDNLEYAFQLGKAYALAVRAMPNAAPQAEKLLTEYLEENPDSAEALRLRGQAYAAQGKTDEAMADINRAIELEPDNHEGYLSLGVIYLELEDYAQAIEALRESIARYEPEEGQEDVPFVQGYLTLAAAYEEIGKERTNPDEKREAFSNVVATCDELLQQLPDTQAMNGVKVGTYFRKGVGHRLLGEFGPAVKAFTDAIDLNPEQGEAYYRRAICFTEMGEERLALRDLEATQSLNFEDPRAYLWEGLTFAQMGQYRDAIRAYNEAISFSNRYVDAYLNRAHAYFQLSEYENAIDSFNECIRLQPTQPSHYLKRGLCYQNLGELDQAVRSYINAIQFNENYAPAYDYLIPALERQGRGELADEYRAKRAEIGRTHS